LELHVVSHTHWDREWYHLAGRFRQKLVALIDELLDDPPHAPASFLLDGQTILLEDYLAVRPERAAELSALLRDGRIEAGPWLVLADGLIPSGEALVRNLLAGRRTLARMRATAPPVLYCPDSFGHPAALPELAAGFGLELIVAWRGFGGDSFPCTDVARWEAPSGATALLYHLPPDGYETGSSLPSAPDGAARRWVALERDVVDRSSAGVALLPNGADHHARQPDLDAALASLAGIAAPATLKRSSLRAFAAALQDAVASAQPPTIHGELRDSYGYTWTLQGTLATRASQKRRNARCERTLIRDTEPWLALATLRSRPSDAAGPSPATPPSRLRALEHAAWRTLLECHPHDTLCGCSVDGVARAMELRLEEAESQAAGLRDASIDLLLGQDPAAVRDRPDHWGSTLVVRNRAPRHRTGVAIVELLEKAAGAPVGPRSAGVAVTITEPAPPELPGVEIQLMSSETAFERIESPLHYPENDLVRRWTAAAWVVEAPPYGVRSLPHGDAQGEDGGAVRRDVADVVASESSMSNGIVQVELTEGQIQITDLRSGRVIDDVFAFEDVADLGDSYTPSIRGEPERASFLGARRIHAGPLVGEIVTRWRFDGRDDPPIELLLTLHAGSPLVHIRVIGTNLREDHRLRLLARTRLKADRIWADAAFGPIVRDPAADGGRVDGRLHETPPPTAPLHRYVSVHSPEGGATLYSDGLAEHEVRADGTIFVTLLRAIGELSRNDLPERPGHAGWPASIPEAQSFGFFEAELALLMHDGDRTAAVIDSIERSADDFLLPLTGRTVRSAIDAPGEVTGVALSGVGLAFSSARVSDDGRWVVLRCVNLADAPVIGAWSLPSDAVEVRSSRLDETPGELLEHGARTIPISAGPRQVVTVLLR
jgi:hypothetical protein